MKNPVGLLILFFLYLCIPVGVKAQQRSNGDPTSPAAKVRNYHSFTTLYKNGSSEMLLANPGFENDPEVGRLFAVAPCKDCYELIGKRTETSKTYVADGSDGRDIMLQTSTDAMHYRDAAGRWRTINTLLEAGAKQGVYEALRQPVPVSISAAGKSVSLGKLGEQMQFNHNLELVFVAADGTESPLGEADWTNHTAGDDGVYVTNAWPSIDIEIYVARGAVKTNFYINHALPAYAGGKLLVRDHLTMGEGLSLYTGGQTKYTGNLEIRNSKGEKAYIISAATACEQENVRGTLQMLEYYIDGNVLDIAVPGELLNRAATSYPVIIDPLVSAATVSTVGGSTYSPGYVTGCPYFNPATVPTGVTITDVKWSFDYIASGGAWLNNGGTDYTLGTCRSPAVAGFVWFCNLVGGGTCIGSNISIYSDIAPCIPPPQCASYPLNINMKFYQTYASTVPCASTYVTAGTPLTITVFGRTLEASPISSAGGVTSICTGQSVTLSTVASYGVPPYAYLWNPGSVSGNPVTLSPLVTTTYTVSVTDACGEAVVHSITINVNSIAPITGIMNMCIGMTTTLANSGGSGTWSSNNLAVATVGSSSGIVSGISPGTAIITFTNSLGCLATAMVTVIPMPAAITGTAAVCMGATTTLSSTTLGGGWTTAASGVATVGGATGIVTGVAAGTVIISYTTLPGCTQTKVVTVHLVAPVSGSLTFCSGTTSTLTNATGTGTWASGNTTVAIVGATTGIVTGITAGTATISFTNMAGCLSTAIVTITPLPSTIAGITTVCMGATTAFSSATPGGIWTSSAPGIGSVGASSGIVTGVSPGSAVITYTTSFGCMRTKNVLVNPLPHISGTSQTNPNGCGNSDGKIVLNGLNPGETYTVYYTSGSVVTAIIVASGVGSVTISGLPAGTYSNISVVSAFGCPSNTVGPIMLLDAVIPLTPVANNNSPLCEGTTLLFSAVSSPGVVYTWTGPGGFTATVQNPVIPASLVSHSGTYTVIASSIGCISDPATTIVVVNPVPTITDLASANPTTCLGHEGFITLSGLLPGVAYNLFYTFNGSPVTAGKTADAMGEITITGLSAGSYSNIFVTSLGCTSNSVGPVTLVDPPTPPPPVVTSNAPICAGLTLLLFGDDATPGGSYNWEGPNGFTSNEQNPIFPDVPVSAQGVYTLTYTKAQCSSTGTGTVSLHTTVILSKITASNNLILYGDSVFLEVSGATYYNWTPHNHTLNDYYIPNPVAKPTDSITEYTVYGSNELGCIDSAKITILVSFDEVEYIPNAFTPNGDGLNDVFRIGKMKYKKLLDFTIYDRWGKEMYHNPYDPYGGWDGTYRGKAQDIGVYYYSIFIEMESGKTKLYKGDVTLLR